MPIHPSLATVISQGLFHTGLGCVRIELSRNEGEDIGLAAEVGGGKGSSQLGWRGSWAEGGCAWCRPACLQGEAGRGAEEPRAAETNSEEVKAYVGHKTNKGPLSLSVARQRRSWMRLRSETSLKPCKSGPQ